MTIYLVVWRELPSVRGFGVIAGYHSETRANDAVVMLREHAGGTKEYEVVPVKLLDSRSRERKASE